jgi:hypothetical protein
LLGCLDGRSSPIEDVDSPPAGREDHESDTPLLLLLPLSAAISTCRAALAAARSMFWGGHPATARGDPMLTPLITHELARWRSFRGESAAAGDR